MTAKVSALTVGTEGIHLQENVDGKFGRIYDTLQYPDYATMAAATGFTAADVGRLARVAGQETSWQIAGVSPLRLRPLGEYSLAASDGDTVSAARLAEMADVTTVFVGPVVVADLTAGGSAHTILTVPIGASQDVSILARIHAADGQGHRADCTLVGSYSRSSTDAAAEKTNVHGAPYFLDTSAWSPSLVLSANSVLVQITPDAGNDMRVTCNLEINVHSTSAVPTASAHATMVSLFGASGGGYWEADNAHVSGSHPGYCDTWTDLSGNGWQWDTESAGSGDPQISTLSDATTKALITSGSNGLVLHGATPLMPSAGAWTMYFVCEFTATSGTAVLFDNAAHNCSVMQCSGVFGGNQFGMYFTGAQVSDVNCTSELQILRVSFDGVSTVKFTKNGTDIWTLSFPSPSYTTANPYLLYYPNTYGAKIRLAAFGFYRGAPTTQQDSSIRAGIKAKYTGLP